MAVTIGATGRIKHESPRREASWGHIVQHTVVGVAGAALPIAFPPDGAQEPPVAVVSIIIAAFSPAPEQAAGADRVMAPPPHIASPKLQIWGARAACTRSPSGPRLRRG
jgi:hypothetical protein